MAAVIAPERTSMRPDLAGFEKRRAPCVKLRARAWASKEKMELAPNRASVRSVNSSSARDSVPVRTTFSFWTTAPCGAGRGAAAIEAARVTTFTFSRTTAWERSAPKAATAFNKNPASARAAIEFNLDGRRATVHKERNFLKVIFLLADRITLIGRPRVKPFRWKKVCSLRAPFVSNRTCTWRRPAG
jgi:hypothetical protein